MTRAHRLTRTLISAMVLVAPLWAGSVEAKPEATSIAVPVGRVGDEIAYVAFERVVEGGPKDGWLRTGQFGLRVMDVVDAVDGRGRPTQAVHVAYNGTGDVYLIVADSAGRRDDSDLGRTMHQFLDVVNRSAIRTEKRLAGSDFVFGHFEEQGSALPGFQYQGRTLQPGADVSVWQAPSPGLHSYLAMLIQMSFPGLAGLVVGPIPGSLFVARVDFEMEATAPPRTVVAQYGSVDGRPALGVATDASYKGIAVFADSAREFTTTTRTVEWYRADSPYPVAVQGYTRLAVKGGDVFAVERIASLALHQRGPGASFPLGAVPSPPAPETSAGRVWPPPDGTGGGMRYPLSIALARVS